ncbi:hypothetical protein [Nannocystis punicea]|uniref:Uncharacterized protein n=1 Tax=Nannocystis punicea TaxID=2995304 RepID=A0ABY7H4Z5_9BACT|nr:hypothetical protein [Nannocystis poenicansa]WAS94233.1 hypothetical protein O0S08_49555 [Nannocystis poenicansa]
MIRSDIVRIVIGGLVLAACPGRPGEGGTDSTISGDPGSSSTTGPLTTTTNELPTGTTDPSTTDTSEPTTTTGVIPGDEVGPREGPWEVVVDAVPFPLADIHTLTVGRREYEENFANRGVVEVLFDHEAETITVELRKYVFGDAIDAQELDRLSLWAYAAPGNPVPHPDPATDCTQGAWKDGCSIYAYYDGKSQPARMGMDFRVHLPTGYRGRLLVTTEDNITEESWPRRGDVTVVDLCSSGEIFLEAGRANIRMCRDLSPAPECPPEDVQACDDFPFDGSEAWSADCPCDQSLFGQLLVRAAQPWAANIILDVPGDVWLNAALQNIELMKPHDCKPKMTDCGPNCQLVDDDEYSITAEFNYPSAAAPSGAGFNFFAASGACTKVAFAAPGEPWTPGQTPSEELRGLVKLCTDCL